MSPDPFFQHDALVGQPALARCSWHCHCREEGGFCGARIHPECLRLGLDGSVRVGLSASPEVWFATLNALGRVLHLTRNEVAVFGQIGSVPALHDWHNPVLPRNANGGLSPNLAEHASLRAVREPSPLGPAYGFEACDVSGQAFQRIVLTAPANRELFEHFVTDHQSPSDEAAHWFAPNHSASTRRRRALAGRIPFLRSRHASGAGLVRALSAGDISQIFSAAAKLNLPVRTTHYTPALVRAAVWTPELREPQDSHTKVEFFHSAETGLHVFLPAIASVWLWQGRCDCCAEEHWTVEIADKNEHVALTITVGDARFESDWREMLSALVKQG